jgi:DNA-binding transcriptional LysR family regulator
MKITFDLLQILDAIDRHGSFTAAASALHRVPSALSHAVGKLEDELGVTLFERVGRRAVLNEAGRTLLDDGRHLLRAASDLERRVQRIADGWEAELRIALDAIIPSERLFRCCRPSTLPATARRSALPGKCSAAPGTPWPPAAPTWPSARPATFRRAAASPAGRWA